MPWRESFVNGRPVRARHQILFTINNNQFTPGLIFSLEALNANPEPPGGLSSFMQWFGSYYQYPLKAKAHGVNGTLKLKFIVEEDGSITQIEVLNDLGYGTGAEAVRVLKKSPKWKPGRANGKAIQKFYELAFRLSVQ